MEKAKLITYWIATALLAIGMLQSGIFAEMRTKQWIDLVTALGYPVYFLNIIGTWKILGVIAILVPGFKLVKEWAYVCRAQLRNATLLSFESTAPCMEQNKKIKEPDNTAVRTALWRALHMQADAKPYIIEDELGLKLIAPPEDWQQRPDMKYTKRIRASIVARARFIEDLIIEQSRQGISQYIILGAGLDTFAERRPDIASKLHIYETDQPDTLAWKQQRLAELDFDIPAYLHFVPVDFETSSWWGELLRAGFDASKPAVIACTGVSLYLTKDAIATTLNQIAKFASGSTMAMTFYLPMELLDEEDKPMQAIGEKGAREAGTPMLSFFSIKEIMALAGEAGFKEAKTISTQKMDYFTNRADNLLPASGEVFLLATT